MIPQKERRKPYRVSLLIGRAAGLSAGILEGVSLYLRTHRSWIVQRKDVMISELDAVFDYRPDGVIAMVRNKEIEQRLRKSNLPVLDVDGFGGGGGFPCVAPDFAAVGRMQVRHLIDRGHRRLICFGHLNSHQMRGLKDGALPKCRQGKIQLDTLDLTDLWNRHHTSVEVDRALGRLLSDLPLPLAITTVNAEDAERVAQRCHELDLAIPEQVAIVTVNDDAVSNTLAYPPFTTVDLPWSRIGFLAAERLDRMMRGEPLKEERTLVAPTGVTERRSTESIALPDPQLARAVAYIREHADRKILVDEVAKAAGMSRRLLEDRFHRHLGHSPFREIRHHQVQRVRTLLLESDLTLEEICDQSAFAYLSHLTKAFREEYGMPPGACRRRARSGAAAA